MENAEEILHFLEEFSKRKPKSIPQELNDYLAFVARTGDPVYQWALVKSLFKEKLLNVITDFFETSPGLDIPPYPNVDIFNYDVMKNSLIERLDSFTAAPFTVQRICELLTFPRKQYNRIDKFMRAIEKNILVVSTREPGPQRHAELENGDPLEPVINGSDNNSEYNVDVEMEDISWKENAEEKKKTEPQPSSSDAHINIEDDIESRLQTKQDTPMEATQDKPSAAEYESVTPPETNVSEEQIAELKSSIDPILEKSLSTEKSPSSEISLPSETIVEIERTEPPNLPAISEPKMDIETNIEPIIVPPLVIPPLVIPAITVDDADMTEQKLIKQASTEAEDKIENTVETSTSQPNVLEPKEPHSEPQQLQTIDDSSSDSNKDESNESKLISEVSTSSEESSSSSDITDGSNSPKQDNESSITVQDDSNSNPSESKSEVKCKIELEVPKDEPDEVKSENDKEKEVPQGIQSDNYSISDVSSELPQPPSVNDPCKSPEKQVDKADEEIETDNKYEELKPETEVQPKKDEP